MCCSALVRPVESPANVSSCSRVTTSSIAGRIDNLAHSLRPLWGVVAFAVQSAVQFPDSRRVENCVIDATVSSSNRLASAFRHRSMSPPSSRGKLIKQMAAVAESRISASASRSFHCIADRQRLFERGMFVVAGRNSAGSFRIAIDRQPRSVENVGVGCCRSFATVAWVFCPRPATPGEWDSKRK